MAARLTLSLKGIFEDILSGANNIHPDDIILTPPVENITEVILANGFNAITIPTGAVGFIYIPDPLCTTAKVLKGVTGDTGISLSNTRWVVFNFGTPPASIGITSTGAESKRVVFFWF